MEYGLLILAGLVVIVLVARFASALGVAAPLLLVVVGAGASLIPGVPTMEVPPDLILAVVLPPILYSAAVNVPLVDFRRNLKAITGLSVLLVIVSAFVAGVVLYLLLPALSLPAAIALGAVISPPDAVAATSIGKRLGLPPRLVTVLEGEGLVNDATALVLLRSAIAATAGAFSFWDAVGDFAYAALLAIVVGIVVGYITVWLRSRMNNPVLTTTMSFAVPFLAYLPAEEINASGVLAVVVAGLITGHRSATHFSAQDRITDRINWRTVQFVLEHGVFLLMGFELLYLVDQVGQSKPGLGYSVALGLIATAVLIVVRILFVAPLVAVLRHDERRSALKAPYVDSALQRLSRAEPGTDKQQRHRSRIALFLGRMQADNDFLKREGLGWRGGTVLAWSGMRGVVTLAAAQSLPASFPYRPQLILIAFTVAIVTLLLQGGTLPLLIRLLKIRGTDASAAHAEIGSLIEEISENAAATLDNPELRQNNGTPFDPDVVESVRAEGRTLVAAQAELTQAELSDDTEPGPYAQRRALRLRVLQAERAALLDARATGHYSSHSLVRVQGMLDLEESRLAQIDGDSAH